jgi:hypothetical protein
LDTDGPHKEFDQVFSASDIGSLPIDLALPMLWAKRMPLKDALKLTMEKTFHRHIPGTRAYGAQIPG